MSSLDDAKQQDEPSSQSICCKCLQVFGNISLIMYMLHFLEKRTLLSLAATCKRLYNIISNQHEFWKCIYLREFGLKLNGRGSSGYHNDMASFDFYRGDEDGYGHRLALKGPDYRELEWLRWWLGSKPNIVWNRHDHKHDSNSIDWYCAYNARLRTEFHLCKGVFPHNTERVQLCLPISGVKESMPDVSDNSSRQFLPEDHKLWQLRPVKLWGAILRHPNRRHFLFVRRSDKHVKLLSHATYGHHLSSDMVTQIDRRPIDALLLDWGKLDPKSVWCTCSERYVVAIDMSGSGLIAAWSVYRERARQNQFESRMNRDQQSTKMMLWLDKKKTIQPFYFGLPGFASYRITIQLNDVWCMVYTRPINVAPTRQGNTGANISSFSDVGSKVNMARQIYMYHLPTRRWCPGFCVGREQQSHVQSMGEHTVCVYVCHEEGMPYAAFVSPADDALAEPQQVMRHKVCWRIWEFALACPEPRCLFEKRLHYDGRTTRQLRSMRVDDHYALVYTSCDPGYSDTIIMHRIHITPKQNRSEWTGLDAEHMVSPTVLDMLHDVVWRRTMDRIANMNVLLGPGRLVVQDRSSNVHLLDLETGALIRKIQLGRNRSVVPLIGHVYLVNTKGASNRRASERISSSFTSQSSTHPHLLSQSEAITSLMGPVCEDRDILDLRQGLIVGSLANVLDDNSETIPTSEHTSPWEITATHAVRLRFPHANKADTPSETSLPLESASDVPAENVESVDLEWLSFW